MNALLPSVTSDALVCITVCTVQWREHSATHPFLAFPLFVPFFEDNSTNTVPYDGFILVMCGHGTMGQFVASDDPGCYEKKEEKHKRLSLRSIQTLWNNEHARRLGPFPKIFIKAACRGALQATAVRVRYPQRAGPLKWVHPFAEMVSIYASMPEEPARDSSGQGTGCYLISTLDNVLRDPKWRLQTLESICLRMRRGIGSETCAKEWVDVEHSHSKPILFRRKNDPAHLLTPPQIRVECFCFCVTSTGHRANPSSPLSHSRTPYSI